MRPGRLRTSLCVVAVLAASGLISFRSAYEPDLWWHLAQGREVAGGHIVRSNLFSFVYPNYPQTYTSWLFDWIAFKAWTSAGGFAIQGLQTACIAAALGLTAYACRTRASMAATVAVCAFGWLVLEPRALPRPYVASFAGMAACVWLIERARVKHAAAPLVWLAPLVAVWANVHVECVFGVALVALFGAAEWARPRDLPRGEAARAVGIATIALLCTALTPYGIGLLRYFSENASVPNIIRIAELRPPYLPNYIGFFAWTALAGLAAAVRRRTVTLGELAAIVGFGALGCRYLRLTPLLFFVAAPLVARSIDDLALFGINRRAIAGAAVVAVALMTRSSPLEMVRNLDTGRQALLPPALFSQPAMAFARTRRLHGPVFTSMNLGGFVVWELYPSALVFQDARLQAYPPAHFRAIADASHSPEAWAKLTSGVDWAVVSLPRPNEFSGVGSFDPAEWATAYRDQATEIIVRRGGAFAAVAAPF